MSTIESHIYDPNEEEQNYTVPVGKYNEPPLTTTNDAEFDTWFSSGDWINKD